MLEIKQNLPVNAMLTKQLRPQNTKINMVQLLRSHAALSLSPEDLSPSRESSNPSPRQEK